MFNKVCADWTSNTESTIGRETFVMAGVSINSVKKVSVKEQLQGVSYILA